MYMVIKPEVYQYIKILTCVCLCVHDGSGMFVGRD